MNGADGLSASHTRASSDNAVPVPVVDRDSRGRRRRRKKTLGEKLKRHHAANRVRRIVAILILGTLIIAASMYAAHQSTQYEPVPTYPAP